MWGPAHSPAQTSSALERRSLKAHPFPREMQRRGTDIAGAGLEGPIRSPCPMSPAREDHRSPRAEAATACIKLSHLWSSGKTTSPLRIPCPQLGNVGDHGTALLKDNALPPLGALVVLDFPGGWGIYPCPPQKQALSFPYHFRAVCFCGHKVTT